jgi:hypothetical protein
LQEREIPRKKEIRLVRFGTEGEEEPMEVKTAAAAAAIPLVIDQRKTTNLNRELVMRRLNEKRFLLVNNQKLFPPLPPPPIQVEPVELAAPKAKEFAENIQMRVEEAEFENAVNELEDFVFEAENEAAKAASAEDIQQEPVEVGREAAAAPKAKKPRQKKKGKEAEAEAEAETEAEAMEVVVEAAAAAAKGKRKTKKAIEAAAAAAAAQQPVDLTKVVLRDQVVADRLPTEKEKIIVKAPTYYMSNRKKYVQKIAELFHPYRKDLLDTKTAVSCDSVVSSTNDFDPLYHQKIVRDYLNLYTPYRGLLLYHGLGSGKTCTSIAIAEGMKSNKRVYVLTPASLKMNFFSEMKKCGDELYRKKQYWEFVSTEGRPEFVSILAKALSLPPEFIQSNGGAWLINVKKPANFTDLTTEQQTTVDAQLNQMIRTKYIDINYNGIRLKGLDSLSKKGKINPFDNSVVLIDEAHDFVSRVVNNIKNKQSLSYKMYDFLMSATNTKIVLMTGTPIINYPNEIGILFNILRGYIKTWIFTLNKKTSAKLTTEIILEYFERANFKTYDFVEYSGDKLSITRNPFGFINTTSVKKTKKPAATAAAAATKKKRISVKTGGKKNKTKKHAVMRRRRQPPSTPFAEKFTFEKQHIDSEEEAVSTDPYNGDYNPHLGGGGGNEDVFDKYNGVVYDETGNISDPDFEKTIIQILASHDVEATVFKVEKYKALPDNKDEFLATFVNKETDQTKEMNLFQRRILGLSSYFRSAQEELLPSYVKTAENDIFHIVKTEMSDHQFSIYEKIRNMETQKEKNAKKRKKHGDLFNIASSYRVFSRVACNFVFPPEIERPLPDIKSDSDLLNENRLDAIPEGEEDEAAEEEAVAEETTTAKENQELESYTKRIEMAMQQVDIPSEEDPQKKKYLDRDVLDYLTPKMSAVLENLLDVDNVGLHLIYSHFRTIEGIGIMRLILLANGFAEFKIQKKRDDEWEIVENEGDADKPKFMLYTGTETPEEKEILRNVYNGNWDYIPVNMAAKLREKHPNNIYGEIVKIIMITSSGAQGINLKNTRFVHIIEPYWHMVRIEQVIGRARRICSHQELPEELRTVKVFLYISVLSEAQKKDEKNIQFRLYNISRIDNKSIITTDESLFEIASMKQKINNEILRAVKETAMDCQLYASVKKRGEGTSDDDEQLVCYGFNRSIESNQFSSYPSFETDKGVMEELNMRVKKIRGREITINGVVYGMNQDTNDLYDLESYRRAEQTGEQPIRVGKLVNERGQFRIDFV